MSVGPIPKFIIKLDGQPGLLFVHKPGMMVAEVVVVKSMVDHVP
jgi:hypothetical protein